MLAQQHQWKLHVIYFFLPAKTTVTSITESTTRNVRFKILGIVMTVIVALGMVMDNLRVKKEKERKNE